MDLTISDFDLLPISEKLERNSVFLKKITAPGEENSFEFIFFALIPLAIFWGVLIEAIAEILRREEMYKDTNRKLTKILVKILFINKDYNFFAYFKKKADEEIGKSYDVKKNFRVNIAAALLFQKGTKEQIDYTIQYYSLYLLSSNFTVIFIICSFIWLISNISLKAKIIGAVFLFLLIYFLLRYSLGNFYFAYAHMYKFIYTHLHDITNKKFQ